MAEIQMKPADSEMRAILGVPPDKPKMFNPFYDATQLDAQGRRREAEVIYLELLNHDFDNPVVMAALGMNYAMQEKNGLAHLLLRTALAQTDQMLPAFKKLGITPRGNDDNQAAASFVKVKKSEILNAIGTCYKHENRTTEARTWFEKAQKQIPLNADIQNNLATLNINEGHPQDALPFLDAALSVQPDHPQAHWNKALVHLELGDYAAGWDDYDYGVAAGVRMDRHYGKAPLPHWDGTPGKKLVVYGEQGIGDEILFASVLPDLLRDCPDLVFECHKKLHRLLANSFPDVPIFPTREDELITWPVKPDGSPRFQFDARAALGNVPKYYRRSIESFPGTPYIKPTAESQLRWGAELAKLGPGPKIGISWIGGHKKTRVEVRSLALKQLLPILQSGAQFVSLQYTPGAQEECEQFYQETGIRVHHWPQAVANPDYDQTAGLVKNLDLVITVCTSVVHLAGAMGVPTWVLTPSRPAWRYRLDLDYMPWYGQTVTLFRQRPDSIDWTPVVQEVAENLAGLLSTVRQGVANG
jgi:tetratricopeptide (TPR) repeat protein